MVLPDPGWWSWLPRLWDGENKPGLPGQQEDEARPSPESAGHPLEGGCAQLTVLLLTEKIILQVPGGVSGTPARRAEQKADPAGLPGETPSAATPAPAQLSAPCPGPTCSTGWIFWALVLGTPVAELKLRRPVSLRHLRRPGSREHSPGPPTVKRKGVSISQPGPGKTDPPTRGGVPGPVPRELSWRHFG